MAEWLGAGLQNPSLRFNSGRRLQAADDAIQSIEYRALSSVRLERFPDTEEATGSSPVGPTRVFRGLERPGEPIREPTHRSFEMNSAIAGFFQSTLPPGH